MKKIAAITGLLASLTLGGCVVGAAVNVVGETIEAGVGATGAAAGAIVDVATPDDEGEKQD